MTNTTREQLLDITCQLLEVQGYHATGLNEIIQTSKTPKGSLYYHFPGGKDELTEQALNQTGKIVLERIKNNLDVYDDPAEAVATFIRTLAGYVAQSEYRTGGPITTVASETAGTNDRLRLVCKTIYEAWRGAFADKFIQSGMSLTRAHRLAFAVLGLIEGGIILTRTYHDTQPLLDIAQEVELLIHA
ncbi:MAG: TetR/AcrR family transcriptional regulator [Phototrophicales bacterium]|nr:TetR/AcrR family transcriptional regulator [Phototrophicales bacterium]